MVSCLTMFNLASDATEREVHVLFSGCDGYSRCAVVPPKEFAKPYAFVQFDTPENVVVAMEARQGTHWDTNMPPVRFELSKRNMPDHWGPRQATQTVGHAEAWPQYGGAGPRHSAPPPLPLRSAVGASPSQPPTKRPRTESAAPGAGYTVTPAAWKVSAVGGQSQAAAPGADGPRTLHVGGLPAAMTQDELDRFLSSLFKTTLTGSKLVADHGGGPGRAFVGFSANWAANSALNKLQGFDLGGSSLQASWARKELNVHVAAAPDSGAAVFTGLPHSGKPGKGNGKLADAAAANPRHAFDQGGAKCTLHITGLPFVKEDEFHQLIHEILGDDVVGAKFVDKRDGRPPVAWVRFADEGSAELVASCGTLDVGGSQATVGYARTELDISKMVNVF